MAFRSESLPETLWLMDQRAIHGLGSLIWALHWKLSSGNCMIRDLRSRISIEKEH
jgi:hypothetical protein